jgi:hypothetical protein
MVTVSVRKAGSGLAVQTGSGGIAGVSLTCKGTVAVLGGAVGLVESVTIAGGLVLI